VSYFADLTPHTYTPTDRLTVLNVGWLDAAAPFARGEIPAAFREALRRLCKHPVLLHRGFHSCQFCPEEPDSRESMRMGNGQIRIKGMNDVWYAAPTMVSHYVSAHAYLPPSAFIEAVLNPLSVFDVQDESALWGLPQK
jgi:hypothetical protein